MVNAFAREITEDANVIDAALDTTTIHSVNVSIQITEIDFELRFINWKILLF